MTEPVEYSSYAEAALVHVELTHYLGETRYSVADRTLIGSTLAGALVQIAAGRRAASPVVFHPGLWQQFSVGEL